MKHDVIVFIKGAAMGAANVIPGVSGGTIALVTGIYARLIQALKSFDVGAIKLLRKRDWSGFAERVDLRFLIALAVGVAVSIVTLARIFEGLLEAYPVLIMAFFFGLILASVYYVGKTVEQWSPGVIAAFIIGTVVATSIAFLTPATENDAFWYVGICGVVAVCSMILPGLSGSFVLILLGNYLLVLRGINTFDFDILIPLGVGVVVGLIGFAQLLGWIFKTYPNLTISLMTGFVLGSLAVIWPWKQELYLLDDLGEPILKDGTEPIIQGYQWLLPDFALTETWLAIGLIVVGVAVMWGVERLAEAE
ncbi:MAG: DUF368 domain-containing protein [Rhodothermales bacterium]